jgi:hypothetical protein
MSYPESFWGESSEQVQRDPTKDLQRALSAQALARPAVEGIVHLLDLFAAHVVQGSALREEVAKEPVGVLIGASLPGMVGQAEEDRALRASWSPSVYANWLPRSSVIVSIGLPQSASIVGSTCAHIVPLARIPLLQSRDQACATLGEQRCSKIFLQTMRALRGRQQLFAPVPPAFALRAR